LIIEHHLPALILEVGDFNRFCADGPFIGPRVPESLLNLQPLSHQSVLKLIDLVAVPALDYFNRTALLVCKLKVRRG